METLYVKGWHKCVECGGVTPAAETKEVSNGHECLNVVRCEVTKRHVARLSLPPIEVPLDAEAPKKRRAKQ